MFESGEYSCFFEEFVISGYLFADEVFGRVGVVVEGAEGEEALHGQGRTLPHSYCKYNGKKTQINWQLQLDPSFFDKVFSFLPPTFRFRTARTASSNTSFSPSRVNALHSKYWHLSSLSMTVRAVSRAMGADLGSFAFLLAESLKSILLPTKILTAVGTTFWISGNH